MGEWVVGWGGAQALSLRGSSGKFGCRGELALGCGTVEKHCQRFLAGGKII